jgi:hypothetical protein
MRVGSSNAMNVHVCPVDAKMAVCAMLALSSFVPVLAVAKSADLAPWHSLAAQPEHHAVLPAVELEGGTIISKSLYIPIGRESRPRPRSLPRVDAW